MRATGTANGFHRSATTSVLVADGAFEPHDAGVSEYGQKVIERMNQVGMGVDLGHASDRTKLDACEMSKAPVILSHGNCRALNPDAPRTSTDEAIRKLAKTGGVMGITCIAFMVKGTEPVTVDDVVRPFDHVRDLVGIEHVGLGSDAGVESNDLGDPKTLNEMLTKADPRYHVMERTRLSPASKDRNESTILPPLSSGADIPTSTFDWFCGPELAQSVGRNLACLKLPTASSISFRSAPDLRHIFHSRRFAGRDVATE